MNEELKAAESTEQTEEKKTTNFDVVTEKLGVKCQDAAELMNKYMPSRRKRAELASKLYGKRSQCAFCWRSEDKSENQCPYFSFPLNNCRNNIIRWLEMEVGQEASKTWQKEFADEEDRIEKQSKSQTDADTDE